jgi:type IV secretory pathway VirB4 component
VRRRLIRVRKGAQVSPGALLGPDSVQVLPRRIHSGQTWCETFAVTGYPRQVRPGWLQPLLSHPGAADVSLHVEPLPSEIAADRLRRQLARLESSRRLDENHSKLPDPSLQAAVEDSTDLATRLARGEDRLFRVGLYVSVRANTEQALEREAARVRSVASSLLLDARPVTFRALQGFVATLPLAVDALNLRRTFDTSALATTFPFASTEIEMSGGILLGRNADSGSLIFSNRFALENHNQVILAQSGAGKSYLAKLTVLRSLFQGIEVLVVDPENEYERLAEAVGGAVIKLGPDGDAVNPLDLKGPSREGALTEAALFCHTVCSTLLQGTSPEERAALDRAILAAYEDCGITADPQSHRRPAPLLGDVLAKLDGSSLERSLARRLAPFVAGSFRGLFDRATTMRPEGHLVVFSLRDLPDEPQELRAAGTLAALDAIWRRVRSAERRPRIVVVDEAWLLLGEASAARFLARLAKSARKHWCGLITVTQDVSDVLASDLGQTVLANSATRVLLRQSPHTIAELSKAFALSDGEGSYLQTCWQGRGLYCAGTERASLEVVASLEEHALITTGRELYESEAALSSDSGEGAELEAREQRS